MPVDLQLPLPLEFPATLAEPTPRQAEVPILPTAVWQTLPPAVQAQVRQIVRRIALEVARDANRP